jgi:hypothetical protein
VTQAEKLVSSIEEAGGILTLNGDRLKCQFTEEAEPLLPELKRLRDQVVRLIRHRAEDDATRRQVLQDVIGWTERHCISDKACRCNPRILHREYCRANGFRGLAYEAFVTIMQEVGFLLEGEMLVGIALAVDWDVAYGSATQKRIQ